MKNVGYPINLFLFSAVVIASAWATNTVAHADYFTLGDDKLYYESTGSGFPLVLVSGGSGMDIRQWDLVAPLLAESYRVIRYDPRGLGRSSNPSVAYSDTKDLSRLLDHLQLKQIGLIGLSSSGGFALEFAIQYPKRVASLVLAAPFIPGFEFSDDMMARLNVIAQAAEQGRDQFLDRMFEDPHFIPAPKNRSIRQFAREVMAFNFDKGAGFDPSLPIAIEPPLIEQLSSVSQPTLLLVGELDHSEVARRNTFLATQIAVSKLKTISSAGHNAPLENPEAYLESIKGFLGETTR